MPERLTAEEIVRHMRALGFDPQPGFPHADGYPLNTKRGFDPELTPELDHALRVQKRWPEVDLWLKEEALFRDRQIEMDDALGGDDPATTEATLALLDANDEDDDT